MTTQRADLVHGQLSTLSPSQAVFALNNRWALAAPGDFGSDIDVLNYALTLEYLEAAFYQQGNAANLVADREKDLLGKIQADEEYHVTALTDTIKKLGGKPVKAPGVDFGNAFASQKSFLHAAQTFEDLGVGAYNGAGPKIKAKAVLAAAGSIVQVEARHAGVIRLLNGQKIAPSAFDKGIPAATVLKAAKPFIKG